MTLMEVVIAIGVVAFVIPLILAATGSAGSSRRSAEADTRSAWIAREVQRQMILKWSATPGIQDQSVIKTAFPFPGSALGVSSKTLIFDREGAFVAEGSDADATAASAVPDAAYVVAVEARKYSPAGASPSSGQDKLARVDIRVIHPAKSAPGSRSTYRYNLVTTEQGTF